LRLGRITADVAGELGEDVPVAPGYRRAAIDTIEEQVFAVGNPAPASGLAIAFARLGIARFPPSFSSICYLAVT
jgi:hypothetical protein